MLQSSAAARFAVLLAALSAAFLLPAAGAPAASDNRLTVKGPPSAVPTFQCLGLYLPCAGDANENASVLVRYRRAGEAAWREGPPLVSCETPREFRGSLFGLVSGATYEIELEARDPDGVAGEAKAAFSARTLDEKFPVVRTIRIAAGTRAEPLVIDLSGTARGYVLYAPAEGGKATIDVAGKHPACVVIRPGTSYVIVRGLRLLNAAHHGVDASGAHHLVIERCEIAGWGRPGGNEKEGDMDAGVYARQRGRDAPVSDLVIQDNHIHAPRGDTNSWQESKRHPAGPQGITLVETDGRHILRYNRIEGDAKHWFNDGIGGGWNDTDRGSPHRDSDIHGNEIRYCRDDAVESEGGNVNVRIWGNRLANTYTGVALAPVRRGPAYVLRNVITDFDECAFKLGWPENHSVGPLFIFHNTAVEPSRGAAGLEDAGGPYRRIVTRNNILAVGGRPIYDRAKEVASDYDHDFFPPEPGLVAPGKPEPHAVRAPKPGFVRPETGDFSLAPGSPALDRGLPLPGLNDGFRGKAPDLGALEQGDPTPRYGPRTEAGSAPVRER